MEVNINSYEELENKIIEKLIKVKFVVLATSNSNGDISACQMCLVSDGLDVYFQTDSKFEKIRNLKENNKVAINVGDYYFKGEAEIIGHPTINSKFIQLIKEKYIETYNFYTNLKDELLIKVKLTEAKIWGIDNNKSVHEQETITTVDMINKKVSTITCDKIKCLKNK